MPPRCKAVDLSITNNSDCGSLLIILGIGSLLSWLIRYRYLNMYARLPPEPQRKEPRVDLFPDTQGDSKPGLANYLDEFLSAIKVFGYCKTVCIVSGQPLIQLQ